VMRWVRTESLHAALPLLGYFYYAQFRSKHTESHRIRKALSIGGIGDEVAERQGFEPWIGY
jgi:hypothetical protein